MMRIDGIKELWWPVPRLAVTMLDKERGSVQTFQKSVLWTAGERVCELCYYHGKFCALILGAET